MLSDLHLTSEEIVQAVQFVASNGTTQEARQATFTQYSAALIEAACLEKGVERLRDVKEAVPPYVGFEDIKLVVAHLRAENRLRAKTA